MNYHSIIMLLNVDSCFKTFNGVIIGVDHYVRSEFRIITSYSIKIFMLGLIDRVKSLLLVKSNSIKLIIVSIFHGGFQ